MFSSRHGRDVPVLVWLRWAVPVTVSSDEETARSPHIRSKYTMSNGEVAKKRLEVERKRWRKDHPFGFYAKPVPNTTGGGFDMMKWTCGVSLGHPGLCGMLVPCADTAASRWPVLNAPQTAPGLLAG